MSVSRAGCHVTLATFAAASLFMCSYDARASGVVNEVKVAFVRVDKTGKGYVKFASPLTDDPAACSDAPYKDALAFDSNTVGGRSILAIVLSAQARDAGVTARGTGTCSIFAPPSSAGVEDWSHGWSHR